MHRLAGDLAGHQLGAASGVLKKARKNSKKALYSRFSTGYKRGADTNRMTIGFFFPPMFGGRRERVTEERELQKERAAERESQKQRVTPLLPHFQSFGL